MANLNNVVKVVRTGPWKLKEVDGVSRAGKQALWAEREQAQEVHTGRDFVDSKKLVEATWLE